MIDIRLFSLSWSAFNMFSYSVSCIARIALFASTSTFFCSPRTGGGGKLSSSESSEGISIGSVLYCEEKSELLSLDKTEVSPVPDEPGVCPSSTELEALSLAI